MCSHRDNSAFVHWWGLEIKQRGLIHWGCGESHLLVLCHCSRAPPNKEQVSKCSQLIFLYLCYAVMCWLLSAHEMTQLQDVFSNSSSKCSMQPHCKSFLLHFPSHLDLLCFCWGIERMCDCPGNPLKVLWVTNPCSEEVAPDSFHMCFCCNDYMHVTTEGESEMFYNTMCRATQNLHSATVDFWSLLVCLRPLWVFSTVVVRQHMSKYTVYTKVSVRLSL